MHGAVGEDFGEVVRHRQRLQAEAEVARDRDAVFPDHGDACAAVFLGREKVMLEIGLLGKLVHEEQGVLLMLKGEACRGGSAGSISVIKENCIP